MIITLNGMITAALQKRSGVSQTGNAWAVQSFIITDAQDEKLCFDVFGDEHIAKFSIGQNVSINCAINCREWNGKYFTSLRYVAPQTEAQPQQVQQVQQSCQAPKPTTQTQTVHVNNNNDPLPF